MTVSLTQRTANGNFLFSQRVGAGGVQFTQLHMDMINASPKAIEFYEWAAANNIPIQIRGTEEYHLDSGTYFETRSGRLAVVIDPTFFTSGTSPSNDAATNLLNSAANVVVKGVHEIRHAQDHVRPNGATSLIPNESDYATPGAYSNARSGAEGRSSAAEGQVDQELQGKRFEVNGNAVATFGANTYAAGGSWSDDAWYQANFASPNLTSAQSLANAEAYGAARNFYDRPSTEVTSTYFQQNVADYAAYWTGIPRARIENIDLGDDGSWGVDATSGGANVRISYGSTNPGQTRPQIQSRLVTQGDDEGYTLRIRDDFITGRSLVETVDPSGAVVGSVTLNIPASEMQRLNGSIPNPASTIVSPSAPAPVNAQLDSDGAGQVTYMYANGNSAVVTFANGRPVSSTETLPAGNNTVLINDYRYNASGQPIIQTSRRVTTVLDTDGEYRNETVTTYTNGVPSTDLVRYFNGNEYAREPQPAAPTYNNAATSTAVNDIFSFYNAVRSGQPIPILASGVRLLNNLPDGPNLGTANTVLGGVSSFYNLYNAFQGNNGVAQLNATLSTINYFNTTFNATNGVFNSVGAGSLNSFLNGGSGTIGALPALGLISAIQSGDPIGIAQSTIGLFNPGLLFQSGVGFTPLGWFFIGATILKAVFTKPPRAWGVANVTYGDGFDNLKLKVNATGELFGKDRVKQQLNNLIDAQVTTTTGQTVRIGLQAQIDEINAALPASERIGLIAQRMPGLSWRASDLSDSGYSLVDIDPLTGAQRFPFRRFDDDGIPFSSNPALYQVDLTDPQQRIKFDQALLQSAYSRQAIAPLWEVKTAKLQGDGGQVDAGLSEEERASKAGYAAKLDTAYAAANPNSPEAKQKRVGHFMPVALDLDGDGLISKTSIAEQNQSATDTINPVSFNWDNLGFKKQTGWIKANDGFLVLDRDFNQSVDNGTELLSNPLVADPAKGLRSLAVWDANGDGKIDALDPIYKQLKIWQDFNQDGDNTQSVTYSTASGPRTYTVQDEQSITVAGTGGAAATTRTTLELNSLADWGIKSIDYNNGRYEFDSSLRNVSAGNLLISAPNNGQGTSYASIQTLTLDASNDGIRYTPVGAGIRIDDSTGKSEILITQIKSDSVTLPPVNQAPRLAAPLADVQMQEDSVLVWSVPAGAFTDLNTNDSLNYTVQVVGGAQNAGQALPSWLSFDAASGQITARPGNAQVGAINLRVIATDRSGAAASDVFTLTVNNVNDAPVVTGSLGQPSATATQAFSYILPSDLFADVDARDALTWTGDEYYKFNSTLRNRYAGYLSKTLSILAGNDELWRIAA